MANHLQPTITSTYSNFVSELDARFDDLAVGLDPAVTTATNVPTNSVRWSSASNKWQKYNGSAWNDLAATYAIAISGNAATVTNGVYTNATYANPAFITSLTGSKITGDIAGNAGSATQLATARNINGVGFNGTAAISVNLNNNITFNNAGTGVVSGATYNGGTATTISYNTIGSPSISGLGASGSWGINITGSAATATALQTARTIGGVSFNGTANINLPGVDVIGNQSTTGNAATATKLSSDAGGAPSYSCRAWARVNGNSSGLPGIYCSGNVSSVTEVQTGVHDINYIVPFITVKGPPVLIASAEGYSYGVMTATVDSSNYFGRVICKTLSDTFVDTEFNMAAFQ